MSAIRESTMIEAACITHRFGHRVALQEVSLQVPRACVCGLLGPNGGGKTTLFRILATLLTPSAGSAKIAGFDVVTEKAQVRRHIGIVFQNPSLDGRLTVTENLIHQGYLYGMSSTGLHSRSRELLERFGIADRATDLVDTLSGGLRRRVEIAKCLLHGPALLLLDEPSTGLDPAARIALMRTLIELRDRDGVTSLITTHLMDEAVHCDLLALLDQGRMIAVDTPDGLTRRIGGDIITIRTHNPGHLARAVSQRWNCKAEVIDDAVRMEQPSGAQFVPQLASAFPGEIESITVGRPTLEDVFVHLTGHALTNSPDSSTAASPVTSCAQTDGVHGEPS